MKKIAIFASGNGTNAQNIAEYFNRTELARVSFIFSNKSDAFVLERARKLNIPAVVFTRKDFYECDNVLDVLRENGIDFIVLAGFLWLIPENLLKSFPRRIVNIHPALLPKYGGKGMYGDKVHQAVIQSGDTKTGISIHYVNDYFDEGEIILQESIEILPEDTAESIANKVHALEYKYFPVVIEEIVKKI